MTAYYNEFDPYAAQWLRNLIAAGHIAPGDVDDRDMREVTPDDIRGYTQVHFFAGIGGWSHALRLAGWPDDRPVWTGSPPCQPFSTAGQQKGVADDRHLAPHFLDLVSAVRPSVVFGEQVAAAVKKDSWLDDLLDVLEAQDYATGAMVLPTGAVGAPHIRQRLWFVAERLGDSSSQGLPERISNGGFQQEAMVAREGKAVECGSNTSGMANSASERRDWRENTTGQAGRGGVENNGFARRMAKPDCGECDWRAKAACGNDSDGQNAGWPEGDGGASGCFIPGGMADTDSGGPEERGETTQAARQGSASEPESGTDRHGSTCPPDSPWRDPDWLFCRDGKWRPVESGTFPLADGVSARVGRLRAYGNAIVPQVAAEIIKGYMEDQS